MDSRTSPIGFRQLLLVVAGIFLICVSNLSFAAVSAAGVIIAASGKVTATSSGNARELSRGSEIFASDVITTGQEASAKIRFTDNAIVSLAPETSLRVAKYTYDDSGTHPQGDFGLSLDSGTVKMITGLTPTENFSLKSQMATLGIRGTVFTASMTNNTFFAGVDLGSISISSGGQMHVLAPNTHYIAIKQVGAITKLTQKPSALKNASLSAKEIQRTLQANKMDEAKFVVKQSIDDVLTGKSTTKEAYTALPDEAKTLGIDQATIEALTVVNGIKQNTPETLKVAETVASSLSSDGQAVLAKAIVVEQQTLNPTQQANFEKGLKQIAQSSPQVDLGLKESKLIGSGKHHQSEVSNLNGYSGVNATHLIESNAVSSSRDA